MIVRMTVTISGSRDGRPWPRRGETIELPDEEAASLCASRLAVPIPTDDVEKRSAKRKPKPRPKEA
jgi:hypothetical protein